MKKKLFLCIFSFISILAYSQVPFVTYTPVQTTPVQTTPVQTTPVQIPTIESITGNSSTYNNSYKNNATSPTFQIVGGYYYDNNSKNFKRIKIKINTLSTMGGMQIFLRGTFNSQINFWSECNTLASKVNSYTDGEVIANNFEWKAQDTSCKIIYFNY